MKERTDTEAIIYCRVSSARQVSEGHGLESQEARCREYAARMGYQIARTFYDEGVSGGDIDRPAMRELFRFLLQQKTADPIPVIIDDINRLARDIEVHHHLRAAIAEAGGHLVSPAMSFGDSPDDRLIENLLASVSQHQRQKNTEQVKNRMRARVLMGYWLFAPPIGYRFADVPGHGRMLVPKKRHAKTVREALEGYASGRFASIAEVKRFLESVPSFPKNARGAVHFDTVRAMLERPLYAGRITLPRWNIRLQPAQHEALITFATFERIQDRLAGRPVGAVRRDARADFPLRGFVTCTCCDRPMTGGASKGRSRHYAYYFCNTKGCAEHRRNIRGEQMETEFEAVLRSVTPRAELVGLLERMIRDLWEQRLADAEAERARTKRRMAAIASKIEERMERLFAAKSEVLVRAYEPEIEKLERERIILSEKAAQFGQPKHSFEETVRTACKFLANPWKLWASDRLEDNRLVLRLAFGGSLPYCRNEGFRTTNLAMPFKVLDQIQHHKSGLVEGSGFDPVDQIPRQRGPNSGSR